MPCDLDDACRAMKPAIQENFPAAARLLADQVFLPVRCSTTFRPRAVQARPAPSFRSGVDGDKGSSQTHGNERNHTMANALGYVSETKTGFEGALAMMNLSAAIRIEKNAEKAADGQPDYRIFAGETSTDYAE